MSASRSLRLLDSAVEAVATTAFVVMFAAAIGQVVFRYVLHLSVPWTEELARVLFTWSMLLGIAIAIRRNEHINVEVLTIRLPPRGRAALLLLFGILILALLISLARGTLVMIALTWSTYLIALDWLREGWLYVVQLAAIVLMMLYTGLGMAGQARALRASGQPAEDGPAAS